MEMPINKPKKQKNWKKFQKNFDYTIERHGGQKIELDYETPFQLLCAVILSAQTTDKQVNRVTPPLFARVKTASDMQKISLEEIESYLQYINFFRNKSRFIKQTGEILATQFDGKIPNNLKTLQTLPGVGIKTAKVVMGVLYDAPFVGVDTHIHRVLNRWGVIDTKTPNETDRAIDAMLPEELKKKIHHPLVLFGRYHCTAKNPKCENCEIIDNCQYAKNWKKKIKKAQKVIKKSQKSGL